MSYIREEHSLTVTYGTSRGRDTYGYNLVTLDAGHKKYRTCGGGYDMRGTVFADWLQDTFQDRLYRIRRRMSARYSKRKRYRTNENRRDYYGGCWNQDSKTVSLDGACGFDSI